MDQKRNDLASNISGTFSKKDKNGAEEDETDYLPNSLRNASPELRLAIRRRQNNESARRFRAKKKEEEKRMENQVQDCEDRLRRLESKVDELTSELTKQHGTHSTSTERPRSSLKDHSKLSRRASHHTINSKITNSK